MKRFASVVSAAAMAAVVVIPMKWVAKLAPKNGGTVSGSATIEPGSKANTTHVVVMLTGGTAGATYPWHVHSGNCANAGGPVGPAAAYTPIKAGSDGTGKADVTVPTALDDNGTFSVNVHKSPSEMGTIIACGDLTMGGM